MDYRQNNWCSLKEFILAADTRGHTQTCFTTEAPLGFARDRRRAQRVFIFARSDIDLTKKPSPDGEKFAEKEIYLAADTHRRTPICFTTEAPSPSLGTEGKAAICYWLFVVGFFL